MNIKLNDKCLITVSDWFSAPDGKEYVALHGTVTADDEKTLTVGNTKVMQDKIITVIKCSKCNFGVANSWDYKGGKTASYERPSKIYNADIE